MDLTFLSISIITSLYFSNCNVTRDIISIIHQATNHSKGISAGTQKPPMLFPIVFLRASVVYCGQDEKTTFHVGETPLGTATLLQSLFW